MTATAAARTTTAPDPEVERILAFVRKTVAEVRPACSQTLPSVTLTLGGIIQATEMAAEKVLDEAEVLAAHRQRLHDALTRLAPELMSAPAAAKQALIDAARVVEAMSASITSVMAAMEFQDLTAQHLRATIAAVGGMRQRLGEVLALVNINVDAEVAPVKIAEKLGAPAAVAPWRQDLADRLLEDMKDPDARAEDGL
ncbi:MAG TPA: protein phosphatase CheZ [Methylomirabilota bacterium]|jgi:chemotaxis regulatin CheY-phosphate phosphatase CheZ